jgi:hypothetical protein
MVVSVALLPLLSLSLAKYNIIDQRQFLVRLIDETIHLSLISLNLTDIVWLQNPYKIGVGMALVVRKFCLLTISVIDWWICFSCWQHIMSV